MPKETPTTTEEVVVQTETYFNPTTETLETR